jgi:DNA (cytosine-5)-methyltransferase 1
VNKHFDVLAHFEESNYGVPTFKKNFPDIPVYFPVDDWPIEEYKDKVDWVYCNPPCAVFSAAGKSHGSKDGWKKDPRLQCYKNAFSLLGKLRPKILTIESVTNAYKNGKEFLQELEKQAEDLGYSVTHLFINGQDCGLPQKRLRHFFVVHKGQFIINKATAKHRTVKEVIGKIKKPGWHRPIREDLQKYLPIIKANEGFRLYWEKDNPPEKQIIDKNGRVTGRPRMMEARLPWDKNMGAFIGDFYIHPNKPRSLGVNEARALCGYPSNWKIGCTPPSAFSEFARAVLPPVAEWLASQVIQNLQHPPLNKPYIDHIDFSQHSLFTSGEEHD